MVFPYISELVGRIKAAGKKVIMHSCGSVVRFVPLLIEMGVDALNPVQVSAQGMNPRDLVREFGKDIAFWGGGCDSQHAIERRRSGGWCVPTCGGGSPSSDPTPTWFSPRSITSNTTSRRKTCSPCGRSFAGKPAAAEKPTAKSPQVRAETRPEQYRKKGNVMKIVVVGTGYVGLVTGTCLAETGNDVTCVDCDRKKIDILNRGDIPIYEPGLAELVARNVAGGRLSFTTDLGAAAKKARLVFLAVGTPPADDGSVDLSALWSVVDQLAPHLTPGTIVVCKSTVPVGTNAKVAARLKELTGHDIDVASNPEFLKEGMAIDDFMKPDRVVVGARRPEVVDVLADLYQPYLRTDKPFLAMSPESAEMTKYAANALLSTKISFINEMANVCEAAGADINEVRRGIGHDSRIGFAFLFPGIGYGGSCFPKDVRAGGRGPRPRRRAVGAGCRPRGQRAAEERARPEDRAALRRQAGRQGHRHLGAGLQARHRRHPRGASLVADRAAARAAGDGPRLRPGGDGATCGPFTATGWSTASSATMPCWAPMRWPSAPNGSSSCIPTSRRCGG